jgi:cytochrome c oxidase cbb3-type subunit I/II
MRRAFFLFLVTGLLACISIVSPMAGAPPAELEQITLRGKAIYLEECASCHGARGDGLGEVGAMLEPQPRNFTTGVYKFRSTPTGRLPTDDDLLRTITVGLAGTSMDGYAALPEKDRRALVAYLKTFSSRFSDEPPTDPIVMTPPRASAGDLAARGESVYVRMQCAACHGPGGRGDGPLSGDLNDEDGRPIRPADLTQPRRKSGKGPEAIYRTVMTGLDGTPMPSYGDTLVPEEAWELAVYIQSLSQQGATK